jgi:hypothetical protein
MQLKKSSRYRLLPLNTYMPYFCLLVSFDAVDVDLLSIEGNEISTSFFKRTMLKAGKLRFSELQW